MKLDGRELSEAEENVIKDLTNGHFRISEHADLRQTQRTIGFKDIKNVGKTARSIKYQRSKDTYLVEGNDRDGLKLEVACGYDGGLVIVTVF